MHPLQNRTKRMFELLTKITEGKGEETDLARLDRLSAIMSVSSLCGLGRTAPNPFITSFNHFKGEYLAHIRDKSARPGSAQP